MYKRGQYEIVMCYAVKNYKTAIKFLKEYFVWHCSLSDTYDVSGIHFTRLQTTSTVHFSKYLKMYFIAYTE
jgi:hypothetical protein